MFAKLSAVLALFALAAQVAVATPPACLIAAVNTQSDPSDIKSVCTDGASDVQKYLSSNCGNNLAAATSAFAATCKSTGVTVSTSSPTKSSATTGSTTGTGSTTATGSLSSATLTNGAQSGFHTQTANSASPTASTSGSGSGSGSSSGTQASQTSSAISTGGAARLSMDIVGLAAIGLAGLMVAM